MRITTELWIHSYVRGVTARGGFATIARRGDDERGAVAVVLIDRRGNATLYGPRPGLGDDDARVFHAVLGDAPRPLAEIAAHLERQARFDEDMWIVDVEGVDGEHGLDL